MFKKYYKYYCNIWEPPPGVLQLNLYFNINIQLNTKILSIFEKGWGVLLQYLRTSTGFLPQRLVVASARPTSGRLYLFHSIQIFNVSLFDQILMCDTGALGKCARIFGKPWGSSDKINLVTNVLDRFMCKYLNINFFGCFRFIFRHWSLMRAQSESVINEVNL